MSKVIVGMSGGVDSAVTAYLLKLAGYDVIGVTLRVWTSADGKESRCCEIDDARRVAWHLEMPYYVVNCVADFKKMITDPFIEAYLNGVTPNPCVLCNRYIKWDKMLESAKVFGADLIATGHYATVTRKDNGRYTIKQAEHVAKDQTYMLYRLTQEQLQRTIMPLGKLSKEEVRELAEKVGLPIAAKPDSQEICFVTDGNYADYIKDYSERPIPGEGDFIDEDGRILGKHKGIIHYTVGQRKGLGLSLGYPAYIKEIKADDNDIVIAGEKALYSKEITCFNLNYLSISSLKTGDEINCRVKIRYHHQGENARIMPAGEDTVRIVFHEPVRAVAPGQSAVFYDEEGCVIGGGIIKEVR